MHFDVPHTFGSAAAAKQHIIAALAQAKSQLGSQGSIEKEDWDGDTLTFAVSGQDQSITGTLEVTDKQFIVDAKLPLMLRMFEGQIQKMIEQKAGEMLKDEPRPL